MKRKRQTKKIEERLAKLIPLIQEANSMAEELRKPVRFEAKLTVKNNNVNLSTLDELRNLKTIDVTIRVTALDNGNVWNWSVTHTHMRKHLRLPLDLFSTAC
jgi:5-keto 4-deoxyuronate isomerase